MLMCMGDMLAARRLDIPSDRDPFWLELIELALRFRQHLTEVGPLGRIELQRRLEVPEGNS
ncbi:hypothetical protein AKG12_26425 [Agrobacterium sp. SUL3]|nr:hypothetical protein AKG12_26425 [Agrobacterium sp. SUL3]